MKVAIGTCNMHPFPLIQAAANIRIASGCTWASALCQLFAMQPTRIWPDAYSYNSAMNACKEGGRERAREREGERKKERKRELLPVAILAQAIWAQAILAQESKPNKERLTGVAKA